MTDVTLAAVGVLTLTVVALIRVVWRLSDRVSRLEGRLNGRRQ